MLFPFSLDPSSYKLFEKNVLYSPALISLIPFSPDPTQPHCLLRVQITNIISLHLSVASVPSDHPLLLGKLLHLDPRAHGAHLVSALHSGCSFSIFFLVPVEPEEKIEGSGNRRYGLLQGADGIGVHYPWKI